MALDILVVDDEQDIRELVAGVLEDEGYAPRVAANSSDALAALAERRPSLVLLDVWLQGSKLDGLQLLEEIKRRDPTLPVLMISGHGNIDTAVAAIRQGAADFIEKPFEASHLLHLVARATETERLRRENEVLRAQIGHETELTGSSVAINTVRATLKRVAPTGSRILITGPAGVGKEVAARLLHNWSTRAQGPFIVVSAARMTPERVEEELFGVEEGGELTRPGLLEQAHGGTLFLDEIADMPLPAQAKILRVLTDQSFTRVGGQRIVKVDMRVISSTSRQLAVEITEGRFREDLFYRLNVVPVHLPALAERREDIPELVNHFVARYAADQRLKTPTVSDDAMAALQAYDWPGNVRQLRNVVERTIILAPGARLGRIEIDMLPPEIISEQAQLNPNEAVKAIMGTPLREARETFEREYLRIQIRRFSGNISRTAIFIGMERSALHRKLKALGISDGKPEQGE
ncbi:sigma-54-dependent transcriptional regulator [Allosphingosinicella vermicomposti]|uniref:nitrogen assimilation response regulator NtrX n=1 Tax=Allosphingosinicella vermicomposti TaxID=614671 RepID=UPI000D101F16|nr:sigma-54 dependent transcriptional regulator [Allosphingosinicella vermicomposti]